MEFEKKLFFLIKISFWYIFYHIFLSRKIFYGGDIYLLFFIYTMFKKW